MGRHGGHWKGWDVMEGVQTVQEASKTDCDARKTAQERSKRIRRRARSARTGLKRLANGPKHPQEACQDNLQKPASLYALYGNIYV